MDIAKTGRGAVLAVLFAATAAHGGSRAAAGSETIRGYLMPFKCRLDEKATHTRSCALQPECLVTGYGLALDDGSFVQFDLAGNERAVRLLRRTQRADRLIAVADGRRVGSLFRLRSLRLE